MINTDNTIIGGHARYYVLKQKGEIEAECYIPDRKLTKKEIDELNVRLNKNIAGEWDFNILANDFELEDLLEWGFEEKDFNLQGDSKIDLSNNLDETYEVVIECISEREQEKVYNQLTKDGYKCRILTL